MRGIYSLIIKEFLAVWQDKKSRIILIIPPILQLFIFAFVATLEVTGVSIAILNRDEGKLSYELVERLRGVSFIKELRYIDSNLAMRDEIDRQRSIAAIHIDENFSKDIFKKKRAKVQIILDGRRSNSSQIVEGYLAKIINDYGSELFKKREKYKDPILISRNWFNPNLIYRWFTVPGLVAILTMFTGLLVSSLSVARERELGTFDQLLVAPLRIFDILIGKTFPGVVIGMAEGSIILVVAIFIFRIPFTGSIFILYLSMFLFVLSVVGVGLFLSSICRTQQQALLAVYLFMSTSVILSGFATPVDNMPIWLQKITYINPLRFFIVIIRGIFLKAMPPSLVFRNLIPISISAFFNLLVASLFFKRRLE